ncbi:hypothetical protein BZG36_05315 [Bifiguratus adelaidae]|uniref:t-SNARE coiled-coil homology domain-containing protein n=1 Tax=Bifiguratus adelaidae TaxID=1938954 RepID=A0A261XTN5_9FUNG|nr:hypothetical protein BZG36_05315 [Bifiguratus adelaidae]
MTDRYTMSRDRLAELQQPQQPYQPRTTNRYDNYAQNYNSPPSRYDNYDNSTYGGGYDDRYVGNQGGYGQNDQYAGGNSRYGGDDNFGSRGGNAYGQDNYEMNPVQSNKLNDLANAPPADLDSMDGFFSEVESLKQAIANVNTNVSQIQELHAVALTNINEQASERNSRDLNAVINETNAMNQNIKKRIKAMEAYIMRQPPNAPDLNLKRNQHGQLQNKFLDSIQRFQAIESDYNKQYKARIERQIRIVKPNATAQEIDQIIESDNPQIFAQSLMTAQRSGQARAVLSEVQTRHDDIKKIEKTILELHQLFMDMQMMVGQQGETINNIEQYANEAVVHIDEGNKQVGQAVKSARATRAKKWFCFFLTIIILVVLAILIWWFAFNHKGCCGNP